MNHWLSRSPVWSAQTSGSVIPSLSGTFPPSHPRSIPSLEVKHQADIPGSGAGPIGLVTALAAHAAGCTPIVLTDLVASRLEFAKTLLPNIRTVQIPKGTAAEGVAELIKDAAGGMVNVALECTGFESSIRAAIFVSLLSSPLVVGAD